MATVRRRPAKPPTPITRPATKPATPIQLVTALMKPGRPPRDTPRLVHLPGMPLDAPPVNISTRLLSRDAPPPRCVWPQCLNQALLAGNQPAEHTFTRRWRAWCYRHRPAAIRRYGLATTTHPRYSSWHPIPPDRPICAVPGCGHPAMVKNRRANGTPRYKRFCQRHRTHPDLVPAGLRGSPPPPAAHPAPDHVRRMRVTPPPAATAARHAPISTPAGMCIPFRDELGHLNRDWTLPVHDLNVLQSLAKEDVSAYHAVNDPRLRGPVAGPHVGTGHKYPTLLITELFRKWR